LIFNIYRGIGDFYGAVKNFGELVDLVL